nr:hypothetical protein [Neobacillus sp. Marseille-Q6967]
METLEYLVYLYNRNMAGPEDNKLSDFRKKSKPLEELIKDAVYGRLPNCNQDSHQSQIDRDVLDEMERRMLDKAIMEELKKSKHFNDIFTLVYCLKVPGFASLCVYDTSLRLGAVLGLFPDAVFLHRGALHGAKNLLGKDRLKELTKYFADDHAYPYLLKSDLPEEIQTLEAHHIENFFCRFKSRLKQVKSSLTVR